MRSVVAKLTLAVALIAFGTAIPSGAQDAALQTGRPQVCDDPTDSISLFAKKLKGGRYGYGFTPQSASVPGPTIEMTEGDCLQINLVNDTDRKLSLHAHGVDYTVASDGTPLNSGCVKPGRAKTFVFQAHLPMTRADGTIDAGSAGYWHYHDHCMGTPHGTDGINRGLFGALIVRRQGDPLPARTCVLVMIHQTFNLKKDPRTPKCRSAVGDRVEFVVIGHGEQFHTFHLHGHRWVDNRTGLPGGLNDPSPLIDNKTVGPADSFGFQVIAGEHVGPGEWMYHCHVQSHSDSGMAGTFVVTNPEGELPLPSGQRRAKPHRGHHR